VTSNQENNNMFDILVYVYEHCRQADIAGHPDRVAKRLSAAGFDEAEITAALAWLAGLARGPQRSVAPLPAGPAAVRTFAPREIAKLDAPARGFLLSLEQSGILSPQSRELVLERALATADACLSVDQIKLIVLMVLWNQHAPASLLVAEELRIAGGVRLPH
jgi:Smg protein